MCTGNIIPSHISHNILYSSLKNKISFLQQKGSSFFDSLELKAKLKINRALELLETFGLEGGYPHVKKLTGSNLWEYRILGSDSIRILYVSITGKIFLILHGFKKKKQKTPTKEIRIAEERLEEYLRRKMNN